jgi:hypothetical protein
MNEKAKDYFLFLVNVYRVKPKDAKIALDKWFEDCYSVKVTPEFNRWYYSTYPEYSAKNHK